MAMVRGVVVIDRGWNRMRQRVEALDGHGVDTGLYDGRSAEIGYYNEFGPDRIPSRPFMRRSIDVRRNEVRAEMVRTAQAVAFGGTSPATALGDLGQWMEDRIKDIIDRSPTWAVPNAPLTVALKGFDHPLIETGEMQDSVEHRIF